MSDRETQKPYRFSTILDELSVRQLLTYFLSVGGAMLAGFLMIVLLVRILPAEVYGELVLLKALTLVVVSLASLGLSQAAVRWVGAESEDLVLGTILSGVLFASFPASLLLIFSIIGLDEKLNLNITPLLGAVIFLLVLTYMLNNELVNWQRAKAQAKQHALISTVRAVQQMFAVVFGVLITSDVSGYVYGLAVGELLLLSWLLIRQRFKLAFQAKLLAEMLRYGWPFTLVISSGFILNYCDRYMLSFMLNDNSIVAYYDASALVVVSIMALMVRPFNLFLFPAYTKCYEKNGQDATVSLINRVQRVFFFVGLVLATLLVVSSELILSLIYPVDYRVAGPIFAPLAFNALLNGAFMIATAGLYISKKTLKVGTAALVAVTGNVFLNWVLIPAYGMNGAAYATMFSSFLQLIVGYYYSRSFLPINSPLLLAVGVALWLGLVNWFVS
jgi:O-antigen/teichoic acid export membrane protein